MQNINILLINLSLLNIFFRTIRVLLQLWTMKIPSFVQKALKYKNWIQTMNEKMKAFEEKIMKLGRLLKGCKEARNPLDASKPSIHSNTY